MLLLLPSSLSLASQPGARWQWWQLGENAQVILSGAGALTDAPPVATGDVVLALPPAEVSWHLVTMPKVSPAKRQAALQGVLEERLLGDAAQLHFAVSPWPADADGQVWVAAYLRDALVQALQTLEQHGLRVAQLLPAWAPSTTPMAWAYEQDGRPCVSFSGPLGVVHAHLSTTDPTMLPWLFSTGQTVQGLASPSVLGLAETRLPEVRWQPESPAAVCQAQGVHRWQLAPPGVPLPGQRRAFGRLSTGLQQLARAPQWALLRWGLAGVLLVQAVGWQAQAWQQKRQWEALQADTRAMVTQTFPHIPLVLDPVRQMQREIDALQAHSGQASPQGLEALLQLLGTVPGPQPVIQAIDFQPGLATLSHAPLDGAQRNAWVSRLTPAGWSLSVTPQGSQLSWRATTPSMASTAP